MCHSLLVTVRVVDCPYSVVHCASKIVVVLHEVFLSSCCLGSCVAYCVAVLSCSVLSRSVLAFFIRKPTKKQNGEVIRLPPYVHTASHSVWASLCKLWCIITLAGLAMRCHSNTDSCWWPLHQMFYLSCTHLGPRQSGLGHLEKLCTCNLFFWGCRWLFHKKWADLRASSLAYILSVLVACW